MPLDRRDQRLGQRDELLRRIAIGEQPRRPHRRLLRMLLHRRPRSLRDRLEVGARTERALRSGQHGREHRIVPLGIAERVDRAPAAVAGSTALRACGRLMVMMATGPSRSADDAHVLLSGRALRPRQRRFASMRRTPGESAGLENTT